MEDAAMAKSNKWAFSEPDPTPAEKFPPSEPTPATEIVPTPEPVVEHDAEPAPVVAPAAPAAPSHKVWRVEMKEERILQMNGHLTKVKPGAELDERYHLKSDIEGLRSTPGIELVEVKSESKE
jgi:hypothetical protein